MEKKAVFDIIASPKSSRSEVKVDLSGNIRIYLNSPPVDGKANAECINLLSKKLKTSKSNIVIEKGDQSCMYMLLPYVYQEEWRQVYVQPVSDLQPVNLYLKEHTPFH